jgi:phosphotransferase system enzyme I (PtsI)
MSNVKLSGDAVSSGIGLGKIHIISGQDLTYDASKAADVNTETKRFEDALEAFRENIVLKARGLRKKAGPMEAAILERQLLLISDPSMAQEMLKLIHEGQCAEAAVDQVCSTFIRLFSGMEDDVISQRASDISDIRGALLMLLLGIEDQDISTVPPGTILVAEDLSPSMTAQIVRENISGIITACGSRTSHLAIIAKAMEIPAVCGVKKIFDSAADNDTAIVDGDTGVIYINPSAHELEIYNDKCRAILQRQEELSGYIKKDTKTSDGLPLSLFCNIGSPGEARKALECGGEGIGLFRSEFLFMNREKEPSEEEQFEAYKKAALIMEGKPVIIRTLDIGGDKDIPYLRIKKEKNPFLGYRGIRYCLGNKKLFKRQLRSLLRASAFGRIRILIPLVTCAEELRSVKELMEEIKKELDQSEIPYDKNIETGCMIETPSACLIADILAKEADFFSIGTNDLAQYILCADRGNSDVSYLDSTFHPSVLRSVKHVIECADNAGIPVGLCGEAAADPLMIPLLIAFGLKEFSVSASLVPRTRRAIHKWSKKEALELTDRVMSLDNEKEIVTLLKKYAKEKV